MDCPYCGLPTDMHDGETTLDRKGRFMCMIQVPMGTGSLLFKAKDLNRSCRKTD